MTDVVYCCERGILEGPRANSMGDPSLMAIDHDQLATLLISG
jgi:hypothetical protein